MKSTSSIFLNMENLLNLIKDFFLMVVAVLLFILMAIGTMDVILRYIFNAPIQGTVEIGKVLLVYIVVLSWAHVQSSRSHVTVDFLVTRFSHRKQTIINVITDFVSLFLFILISWQACTVGLMAFEDKRILQVIHIPVGIMHFVVSFSALLMCLVIIIQIFKSFKVIKNG